MTETFVVIVGDAAGTSAASKAKREDPEREVIVFYVKGEVDDLDDLVTVMPEEFREERDVDLRTGTEVGDIDPEAQTVTVETGDETYEQPYDDLLVATGASAIEPPFDGLGLEGVFTIHDMDEADAIEEHVTERDPKTAAIVGGYVGIEMAEALSAHGVATSTRCCPTSSSRLVRPSPRSSGDRTPPRDRRVGLRRRRAG